MDVLAKFGKVAVFRRVPEDAAYFATKNGVFKDLRDELPKGTVTIGDVHYGNDDSIEVASIPFVALNDLYVFEFLDAEKEGEDDQ